MVSAASSAVVVASSAASAVAVASFSSTPAAVRMALVVFGLATLAAAAPAAPAAPAGLWQRRLLQLRQQRRHGRPRTGQDPARLGEDLRVRL